MPVKQCLVTGAGGFIGSHLVEALLQQGCHVRAFVNYRGDGSQGYLRETRTTGRGQLEVIAGDVTDFDRVRKAVAGTDRVYHLAALIAIPYSYLAPESYFRVNVLGTLNVARACLEAGVSRVIHTSTSEVYGTALYQPIDEAHPLQAQSPYAASKIAADKVMESFHLSFGLPVATVRPFNTYGPRQSARAIIPTIAAQVAAGCEAVTVGSLFPERDFTFVEDTARAFLALGDCEAAVGKVVNVGSGQKISVGDLAKRLIALGGKQIPVVQDEERARPRASEVEVLLAGTQRVTALTGWRPTVSLDEGLRRTLAYVSAHLNQYSPRQYQR
jgi:UDP-glucose 4-epimerase